MPLRMRRVLTYSVAGVTALLAVGCGRSPQQPIVIFLTTGNSWVVPADWNRNQNTIEVIGGGGRAGGSHSGGAGGGGAYSRVMSLDLRPGTGVSYTIGGDTFFNGQSLATASVGAEGGKDGSILAGGVGGAASHGVGTVKFSGGSSGPTGGGGGGAAGPRGNGKPADGNDGGFADAQLGGRGGRHGNPPESGGNGTEWDGSHGAGGGGGATEKSRGGQSGSGGQYGGGAGSMYDTPVGSPGSGLIVITYVPHRTMASTAAYLTNSVRRLVLRFVLWIYTIVRSVVRAVGFVFDVCARYVGARLTFARVRWTVTGFEFLVPLLVVLLTAGLAFRFVVAENRATEPMLTPVMRSLALLAGGLILALSAYLRLVRLNQADFTSADEYVYFDAASKMSGFLAAMGHQFAHPGRMLDEMVHFVKLLPAWARPAYNVLAAVVTAVFGESKTTAFGIAAVSGVLTIAATYWLTRILFNQTSVALLAALLLAVNTGHVLFSRMALQVSSAILFVVIAFAFYARSRATDQHVQRNLMLAAVMFAIAFACHPSVLLLVPAFAGLEIHRALTDRASHRANPWRRFGRFLTYSSLFLGTFVVICAVWELPRLLLHLGFMWSGQASPFGDFVASLTDKTNPASYLGQLLDQGQDQGAGTNPTTTFGYFPSFVVDSQGVEHAITVAIAMAWLGALAVLRLRDYSYLMLVLWTLSVYVLYSLQYGRSEIRVFMVIEPALCISLALCVWHFARSRLVFGFSRVLAAAMIAVSVCSGLAYSQEVVDTQLSYVPMKDFIRSNPRIDKVALNVNTMLRGPFGKVGDWMDGWVVADYLWPNSNGATILKHEGRVAFFYRSPRELIDHPIVKENGPWVHWPEDMRTMYLEGKARYLVSSIFDYQWQLDAQPHFFYRSLLEVKPIFSSISPFASKARRYDMSHAIPEFEKELTRPYFQRIGLYDLRDLFEADPGR